jgi:riboflavin-specific deaminase-like protein
MGVLTNMWRDNRALVPDTALTEERAWSLLLALSRKAGAGSALVHSCGVGVDDDGNLEQSELGRGWLDVYPDMPTQFHSAFAIAPSVEQLLDLYLPLCIGEGSETLVVGHVGQSLDGQIATSTGASCFITGPQDLVHTHRLRALFDAVLVGRGTVTCDDPRLTTRLVAGDNPTRVVVDPGLRVPKDRKVFWDGAAPTLLLCAQASPVLSGNRGRAEFVEIPAVAGVLPPAAILDKLKQRGLGRVFVEGGGVTISHFLQSGLLSRLHVTVSPVFLGQGRPGVLLPKIDRLDRAWRPRTRSFALGGDVLFDCQFEVTG